LRPALRPAVVLSSIEVIEFAGFADDFVNVLAQNTFTTVNLFRFAAFAKINASNGKCVPVNTGCDT
jgi:hypothetical protein